MLDSREVYDACRNACHKYLNAHRWQIQRMLDSGEIFQVSPDADEEAKQEERRVRSDGWSDFVGEDEHTKAYQKLCDAVQKLCDAASKDLEPRVVLDRNWDHVTSSWFENNSLQGHARWYGLKLWWDSATAPSLPKALEAAVRNLASAVLRHVDDITTRDWVACIPLERRFSSFPPFLDFGTFSVVNAAAADGQEGDDVIDKFTAILSRDLNVALPPVVEGEDSYRAKADEYAKSSEGYIPNRPQLVVSVHRGEMHSRKQVLREWMREHVPLIRVCQLACDVWYRVGRSAVSDAVLPDGRPMPVTGLFRIPDIALLIDKHTGHSTQFDKMLFREFDPYDVLGEDFGIFEGIVFESDDEEESPHSTLGHDGPLPRATLDPNFHHVHPPLGIGTPIALVAYESARGSCIPPQEFRETWKLIGAPISELRKRLQQRRHAGGSDAAVEWLDQQIASAVELVASSMYGIGGNLALNCVFATEAIISKPLNESRGDSEEKVHARFVDLASRLWADSTEDASKKKQRCRELYDYRSRIAHSAVLPRASAFWRSLAPQGVGTANQIELDTCAQGWLVRFARDGVYMFLACLQRIVNWANQNCDSLPREPKPFAGAFEKFVANS